GKRINRVDLGLQPQKMGVLISNKEQYDDNKQGVETALEAREGSMSESDIAAAGAEDQGIMIGFACDETDELMPLTASLSHRIMRRLTAARKSGEMPWLRPDAKCQVTVEYCHGKPKRVDTIVVSTQHAPEISQEEIRRQIIDFIKRDAECQKWIDGGVTFHINPSGRFVTGGPLGDAGLTGRKIMVDTYGGVARHGGGAFSGKDGTKVDRSAAYMARYVAKNVVKAGLAERFELQVSYAIGKAAPTSLSVETFGTGKVRDEKISALIEERFDMRPAAIIRDLGLRRPIFKQVAAYGHFGREDVDAPWEETDKAEALRFEAGLA
ncbi:MAG: methionine adenosyltransferase, partial [Chloroflexi bacterium]|nr:methionine adenosyltransferase [Chloroflexota bacterium]